MQSNAAGAEGLSIRSDITWYDKLVTWWTFFQISINERLVYRGDFMLGTLMRFLPTMTQIFFWWAIYDVISTQSADGSLDGIIDKFSGDKIVTLQLADASGLERLRELPNVIEVQPPKIKFRVGRDEVGTVLSQIFGAHAVDDIVVEDPPLEEVISNVFSAAAESNRESAPEMAVPDAK